MAYSVHFLGHLLTRLQQMSDNVVGIDIPLGDEAHIDHLMWADDTEPDITAEQLAQALTYAETMGYQEARVSEYPSVTDQLDALYHLGYEGWRDMITQVKNKYPKPDEISDGV